MEWGVLDPQAKSGVGARGVMQLMSTTYKEVQSKNPELGEINNPEWNPKGKVRKFDP